MTLEHRPADAAIYDAWSRMLAVVPIAAAPTMQVCDGEKSPRGHNAAFWHQSSRLTGDRDAQPMIDEIVAARGRGEPFVAIWRAEHPIQVCVALLRHELEHACQVDAHGEGLLDLYDLTMQVLNESTEPKAGQFYHAVPMERDANEAASCYARGVFGDEVIDALVVGEPESAPMLRRYPEEAAVDSLPDRMIDFLATHGSAGDRYAARHGRSYAALLDRAWPGGSARWIASRRANEGSFPE